MSVQDPPRLHFELLKLLNFAYADPDPTFYYNADPDPAFKINEDPNPQTVFLGVV